MNTAWDVVILGAGIVGAACAVETARRGLRTAIVDRSMVGGGATAAGMGHLVVMDDSAPQLALTRYSQQLWETLADGLPKDVEYESSGTLWIAADEEEMAEVHRKHAVYASVGVESEILDRASLYDAEPHLRTDLAGALRVPSDAVIYPPRAAAFLVDEAVKHGAQLYSSRHVLSAEKGRVRFDGDEDLYAGRIVNALGADAVRLIPRLPIRKRKGHLAITDRYPGSVHHQLVELGYLKSAHSLHTDSVAFNVQPRQTGQLLIGSSRQYDSEDGSINRTILAQMLQKAQSFLPMIAHCSVIRVWTGFRAATPDKLPLIGPWPDDETVLLATGHEGLGITTSLATGRLIADQITQTPSEIPIEPYLPSRVFAGASEN